MGLPVSCAACTGAGTAAGDRLEAAVWRRYCTENFMPFGMNGGERLPGARESGHSCAAGQQPRQCVQGAQGLGTPTAC